MLFLRRWHNAPSTFTWRATVCDQIKPCEREGVDLPQEYQAKICADLEWRQQHR